MNKRLSLVAIGFLLVAGVGYADGVVGRWKYVEPVQASGAHREITLIFTAGQMTEIYQVFKDKKVLYELDLRGPYKVAENDLKVNWKSVSGDATQWTDDATLNKSRANEWLIQFKNDVLVWAPGPRTSGETFQLKKE